MGYRKNEIKKAIGKFISNLILTICVVVFFWSAYQLYCIYMEYNEGNEANAEIQNMALQIPEIDTDAYWKYYVDFSELMLQNADTLAWIRFDEPEIINYPVVSSKDNKEYLTKTFKGEYSIFGTIFVDMRNDKKFRDQNTILYGHNMKNGSMFGSLKKYKEKSYYEEHPYFYIYTVDGMASKYQIVAVQEVAHDSWHYQTEFATYLEFQEYSAAIKEGALYETGIEVPASGKIVTLSTCTSTDVKRLVVQAVKIEERPMEKEN